MATTDPVPDALDPKEATAHTEASNSRAGDGLDLGDTDFDFASRGLVTQHPTGIIDGPLGPAWDIGHYGFITQGSDAPATVNPSLWRQAQLNQHHGLFQVDEGLWQVRGYDISNVTFIEGETGWVIIDPLTTAATAAAALELANTHLGERPVKAVIYTHSHSDHYGGVLGVTSPEAVAAGEVDIIAPDGFLKEVTSEFIVAGQAMGERAFYQFGILLPKGPKGQVDAGLGMGIPISYSDLIAPTIDISATGEERVVDGVRIIFQNTPDAEAKAEMMFFFPDKGWLCTAENCTHTMHNLIPFRGAQARNSLAWSKYISEALQMWGGEATLMFASHHWPRWGNDVVIDFLERQRDLYRWMHDQTMRLAGRGLVAAEIAEELELPAAFLEQSHTRGYYGSLPHNVKAIYQYYLSWYDANPAHLWSHPPTEAGRRYVEFMGGADELLAKARASFDDGDYRWVCEVVNHLVFADPDNHEARALQADALEQLGYQSESATWRNAYLAGAGELRSGGHPPIPRRRGLLAAVSLEQTIDAMGVRLLSDRVVGLRSTVNLTLSDTGERGVLGLSNHALNLVPDDHNSNADCTVTMSKETLDDVVLGETDVEAALGQMIIEGDVAALRSILDNLDHHDDGFRIVLP
ncbi:MAG: MBL fold metallo-hydrolase [Actinomycetia bacterium]|nr:MBL fold metallo-hydrolase [Actinomycetes bacterium]